MHYHLIQHYYRFLCRNKSFGALYLARTTARFGKSTTKFTHFTGKTAIIAALTTKTYLLPLGRGVTSFRCARTCQINIWNTTKKVKKIHTTQLWPPVHCTGTITYTQCIQYYSIPKVYQLNFVTVSPVLSTWNKNIVSELNRIRKPIIETIENL